MAGNSLILTIFIVVIKPAIVFFERSCGLCWFHFWPVTEAMSVTTFLNALPSIARAEVHAFGESYQPPSWWQWPGGSVVHLWKYCAENESCWKREYIMVLFYNRLFATSLDLYIEMFNGWMTIQSGKIMTDWLEHCYLMLKVCTVVDSMPVWCSILSSVDPAVKWISDRMEGWGR